MGINSHNCYSNDAYLHNFSLFNVGHFWIKKKVNLTLFFYYKPYDVSTLSAITHVKR